MRFSSTFILAATMATSAFSMAIIPRQGGECPPQCAAATVTVTVSGTAPTGTSPSGVVQTPSVPTGSAPSAPAVMAPSSVMVSTVSVQSVTLDSTTAAPLPSSVQVQSTNQIVTVINDVKNQSADLDQLIAPLSLSFTGLAQAPVIAAELPVKIAALAKTAADGVSALTSINGIISGANSDTIVTALVDFVKVHQNLLKTISSKHGIIAKFGFAEPVRIALVNLEEVVDSLAFALINVIPSKKSEGMMAKNELDASLNSTIQVYSSN